MSAMPYLLVDRGALDEWWSLIVAQVAALGKTQDWSPDDVRQLIANGDAELWATPGGECFVVVCVNVTPWGRSLFVWVGCNQESGAPAAAYVPQVQAIARHHGCDRFEWESDRAGFRRVFPNARMRYLFSMEA